MAIQFNTNGTLYWTFCITATVIFCSPIHQNVWVIKQEVVQVQKLQTFLEHVFRYQTKQGTVPFNSSMSRFFIFLDIIFSKMVEFSLALLYLVPSDPMLNLLMCWLNMNMHLFNYNI